MKSLDDAFPNRPGADHKRGKLEFFSGKLFTFVESLKFFPGSFLRSWKA
ncbi:MAG: hypothetical protein LBD21_02880 [Tannerellaceae bacterium]|jgi:hypothetical protein|nr:hypothetical protein [Tannerellaceae bacterium]